MLNFQSIFSGTFSSLNNSLPKPRGPNPVATDVVTWKDMQVRLWYPTEDSMKDNSEQCKITEYTTSEYIKHMAQVYKLPQLLISYCFNTLTNSLSRKNVEQSMIPLRNKEGKYPVIVFSHGLMGLPEHYTVICEHLSSNGYIVAAPYHSDSSCPAVIPHDTSLSTLLYDQRREQFMDEQRNLCENVSDEKTIELLYREYQLKIRVENIETCLNILNKLSNSNNEEIQGSEILGNKIDISKVGMLGHSFGGGTAAAACVSIVSPIRFRCGMSLDGWLDPLVNDIVRPSTEEKTFVERMLENRAKYTLCPFAFVNSQHWQWRNNLMSMNKILQGMSDSKYGLHTVQNRVYKFTMPGTHHHNFDDVAVLMPTFAKYMNYVGPNIDSTQHMKELTDMIKSYFDYQMSTTTDNSSTNAASDPLAQHVFHSSRTKEEEESLEQCAEPPSILDLIDQSNNSWTNKLKDVPLIKNFM